MNGTFAVARYTLIELSRRRILLVFLLIGAAGIVLLGVGLKILYQVAASNPQTFGPGARQIDPAIFNHFLELLFVSYLFQVLGLFALLISFAIGMTAIYHDLDSGAAVSIFSKPVSRLAFSTGKVGAAVTALVVIVGVLAVEARLVIFLFGGGLENALTGEVLATVANSVVVMLIVLALTTWVNNIVAAVIAFIYNNVVVGVITSIHTFADNGIIGNDLVRHVFDVLYWIVPHQLISSASRDLVDAEMKMSAAQGGGGGLSSSQALSSVPAASGAGDIVWWAFTVLVFAALVYYSVRRRQV